MKIVLLLLMLLSAPSIGATPTNMNLQKDSATFSLREEPDRKRNVIWPALGSFILPGFDQYWENQWPWAFTYSGVALGGLSLSAFAAVQYNSTFFTEFETRDNWERTYLFGAQIYQAAGGFSAYHSFRSAVRSRQEHGEFDFLVHEESPQDILAAPLKMKYFSHATTIVPVGIVTGLMIAFALSDDTQWNGLSISDTLFSTAFSFGAGTHEEALFRGWILPVSFYYFGENYFWSNTFTAGLFAVAHYPQVKFPIAQFVLGWYLGWLVQRNEWTLEEAVFIHTWWDIVAFMGTYAYASAHPGKNINARLNLPLAIW